MPSPHSLLRLTQSLYNTPYLADKRTFDAVLSYLDSRNAGLLSFDTPKEEDKVPEQSFDATSGIGVLTIRGPLSYRTSGWEGICGGFSYEMMLDEASEMLDAGVTTIVIDADSGGGEAYGCFEATDELRRMVDDAGAKMYGYIDGHACSAMYGIICASDEVIINPYAEAGSIGVLIALYNDSERVKMQGYDRIFVTDGTSKVPFDDSGNFRDGFLEDMQARVSDLGIAFREHVSKYTGLSIKALKDTQAKVFSAKDAMSLGLVNQIMTRTEFVSYITDKHKGAA